MEVGCGGEAEVTVRRGRRGRLRSLPGRRASAPQGGSGSVRTGGLLLRAGALVFSLACLPPRPSGSAAPSSRAGHPLRPPVLRLRHLTPFHLCGPVTARIAGRFASKFAFPCCSRGSPGPETRAFPVPEPRWCLDERCCALRSRLVVHLWFSAEFSKCTR